jgi:hypothetical protein
VFSCASAGKFVDFKRRVSPAEALFDDQQE